MLIVLTGKTASGKDTIMKHLLNSFPHYQRVISTTSRTPRPGEKDGIDYKFVSVDQFKEKIDHGQLLEYVQYGGNFYGTEKTELEKIKQSGLIWRIDPSRAGEARDFIKRSYAKDLAKQLIEKVVVFYITTSDEVILERLKRRNLTESEIEKRMSDDAQIWQENKDNYDHLIENVPGKLDQTIDKIITVIENKV